VCWVCLLKFEAKILIASRRGKGPASRVHNLKLVGSLEEDLCASHDNPRCYPVLSNAPHARTKRARGTPLVAGQACVTNCVCGNVWPCVCLLTNNWKIPCLVSCAPWWSALLCTCDQLVGKGADTPIQTSPPSNDLQALDLPVFSLAAPGCARY
jgi:hypothetical protein